MAKAAKKIDPVTTAPANEEAQPTSAKLKFARTRYEFVLEAHTPIAHSSETIGNESLIMRRKVRQRDGSFEMVPIITGDTLRHGLREASAMALLDAAGMFETPSLTEGALRLLFAGGMVTGKGDASVIKLDRYHELCDLVPTMRLFGGCCDNRVIAGRLVVEEAVLLCEENERFAPAWATDFALTHSGALDTCRASVEEVQRVRMDPTLSPERRLLLSGGARDHVERRLAAGEVAHEESDAIAKAETKSSMMPRRYERICQGALFTWAVVATTYSDLELDTFNVAVNAFLKDAWVGGKRGTGNGHIRAVAGQGVALARPKEALYPIDALAITPKVGELFRAHIAERKQQVQQFFKDVNA